MLTMDLLVRIGKLIKSQQLTIEALQIKPEAIHQSVFNSVANILELIRTGMTEADFNMALKAKAANPDQPVMIPQGLQDIR